MRKEKRNMYLRENMGFYRVDTYSRENMGLKKKLLNKTFNLAWDKNQN